MNNVYVLNEKRYKQVEIECSRMTQEKTMLFLVPETEEAKYISYLNDCLYACDFTILEIVEDAEEKHMDLHYMCTMTDDGITYELHSRPY